VRRYDKQKLYGQNRQKYGNNQINNEGTIPRILLRGGSLQD
jgi:hypothetical protein